MYLFSKINPIYLLIIILVASCSNPMEQTKGLDPDIEDKVETLLEKMTLEEKAGQMTQVGIPAICIQEGYWEAADTIVLDTAKLRKALTSISHLKYITTQPLLS